MFLTDLIGIRGLLLYWEDWVKFHQYIIEEIPKNKYIKGDSVRDYINDGTAFMAELPQGVYPFRGLL